MKSALYLYNTLTRRKELFEPIAPPFVGMYVCGPTVYSEAHLGHARPAVTFDVLYRYLMHLGYNVRYVRNITDVGHLENEADDTGEDKISRRARQERLEPMEVVQKYMNSFHKAMEKLNTLASSIEPRATGHIIEQQQLTEKLIKSGYAYEVNGWSILTWRSMTAGTGTVSFPDVFLMRCVPAAGHWRGRTKSGASLILPCGRRHHRGI